MRGHVIDEKMEKQAGQVDNKLLYFLGIEKGYIEEIDIKALFDRTYRIYYTI